MKAAPMKERPAFRLMTQSDIQSVFHLQMPRWLFTDPACRAMSLEAKVVYTFLLNRFQLSRLNGWTNDSGEVFIIYTRASLAEEIQISYHKVLAAMKELSAAKLIWEKRCGRGDANQIYLAYVEHDKAEGGSAPFVEPDHEAAGGETGEEPRPADLELLERGDADAAGDAASTRPSNLELLAHSEVPERKVQNCGFGTSGGTETEGLEVPFPHPSKKDSSHTERRDIEKSQSVRPARGAETAGQAGEIEQLNEILELCELWTFSPETAKVFENAIERLFFSASLKIGNAVLPQAKVRSHLWELDAIKLQAAEAKLHANTERQIKNSTAYTMAVIFNTIWESESDLMVDPYLNYLYHLPPPGGGSGEGAKGCT